MHVIDFVGIIVDSTNMRFLFPEEKVATIQEECLLLVSRQVASLSQLSQIRGKLTSCETAVIKLHYRQHLMKNRTIHNQLANNVEVPLDHNA